MFSLGNTIREINNDRHRKYAPLPQKAPTSTPGIPQPTAPQLNTNKKDINTRCWYTNISLINDKCFM